MRNRRESKWKKDTKVEAWGVTVVLPAESVTVLSRGVVVSMEVVSLGLGAWRVGAGLELGLDLVWLGPITIPVVE